MFEWLFNYPLIVWKEAVLAFDAAWPVELLPVLFLLVGIVLLVTLRKRPIATGRRAVVFLLQWFVAGVLLVMLWQPVLRVATSEKGENTIAWVVDNSQSMQKADSESSGLLPNENESRIASALSIVEDFALDEQSDFSASLHAIGEELQDRELLETDVIQASSVRTNLVDGIDSLLSSVNDTSLAAVVLLSDGADNSGQIPSEWWQKIKASGVPIHTVGIGQPHDPEDLELANVTVSESAPPETPMTARLHIRHAQGAKVRVRVTSGKELLAASDINLSPDQTETLASINFNSGASGVRQLEFDIERFSDTDSTPVPDSIPGNNRQARIIHVLDSPRRVLYVEGEPRWEFKFIRRALENDPAVDLVSMLRTSSNKFYRQGVESAAELANGFPDNRQDLFRYDAVIIGSLDAVELSTDQQSLLRDFVSIRGGSLLMLAGRQGLADGSWGRSVTAAVLPVTLSTRVNNQTFERGRWQVMPTLEGFRTSWLTLSEDSSVVDQWETLPALADAQDIGEPKPGAVTLLSRVAEADPLGQAKPLLVTQRYGKGRSYVFGTSGTWRWQMNLPSVDERHEKFWQQLMGALVENSVPKINVAMDQTVVRDSETAVVSVTAYENDFSPLQQAVFPLRLTSPDGVVSTVDLAADLSNPGRFTGQVPADLAGAYAVVASTPVQGESPTRAPETEERWWLSEKGNAELYNSQLNADLLMRISDATGGSYLDVSQVDRLQEILIGSNAALKRENRLPLWNMPFLFLLIILLKLLEWLLRLTWKRL